MFKLIIRTISENEYHLEASTLFEAFVLVDVVKTMGILKTFKIETRSE